MKILSTVLALIAVTAPLNVFAADVSIDPPAEPIPVGRVAVDLDLVVAPTSAVAGQNLTYTLTVVNTGTELLKNLIASFDRPAGFVFADDDTNDTLKLGPLAADATITFSFNLTVTAEATVGRIPLELLVSADNLDPTEITAIVEVRKGEVLGAETLAETGTNYYPALVGIVSFLIGFWALFRQHFSIRQR